MTTHPVQEKRARADDDVGQFHRRLLEDAHPEDCAQVAEREVRREIDDVTPRPVAEHDEQCLIEAEAEVPEPQGRIRWAAEVVRDHDVRRVVSQPEHHSVRVRELPGLDGLRWTRRRPDCDSRVRVEVRPVRVKGAWVTLSEQDLHGMSETSEGQGEERGRRSHAAGGAEAAQLVGDHGHAASLRHPGKRTVAFVADELLGYAGNGIGTTTTFVSVALARMGYDIEVLF